MPLKLRIVLVEDHGIANHDGDGRAHHDGDGRAYDSMKAIIQREADFDVVGEAADGEEAVRTIRALQPDIALVDVSLPKLNGLYVTRQLVKETPNVRLLALTVREDAGYVREMLNAGAHGYLLKDAAPADLVRAIRQVADGGRHTPATAPLSDRESRVLTLISEGYSNKEIAAQLGVSVKSVETYKFRAMEKLSLRSRVDVVRYIRERGILPSA